MLRSRGDSKSESRKAVSFEGSYDCSKFLTFFDKGIWKNTLFVPNLANTFASPKSPRDSSTLGIRIVSHKT